MDGGRYPPTIGVRDVPGIILQLTMLEPWKRVDSRLHPIGRYRNTRPTSPCATPVIAYWDGEQKISYPIRFR